MHFFNRGGGILKTVQNFLNKEFTSVVKILDEENMILDHCVSDDQPDRVGDDIDQKGWDTKNYMMNPVVLDGHDYSKPPVGKCLSLYTKDNQLRAKTQFAPTEEGKKYFQLYKSGFMSAFSVGFIPKEYDINKTGGYHMKKQELLEYSVVSVPCNPRAIKSFLQENNIKEEQNMDEAKIKALVDSTVETQLKTLTEKHAAELDTKVKEIEGLNAKIAELEAQVKSGAKISKASADTVMGVCKGLRDHADSLEKFVNDCCGTPADNSKGLEGEGTTTEKDYSDEEIQKIVAEKVQKAVEAASKGGK